MATFHAGQKTHPPVLPQQLALEFESADNPGIRDETGLGRRKAPGVEHVRQFFGFATGDLVRAVVPSGKNAGTHTGRVAVRSSGSFAVRTASGLYTARHKYFRLLQRADGYAYTTQSEGDQRADRA